MTDGLRKSHLRKAHQVGLSEVGLPEGNLGISYVLLYRKVCVKGKPVKMNVVCLP